MRYLYLFILWSWGTVYAQNPGALQGKVTALGEAIPGATIEIPKLKKGTVSAIDGAFLIKEIPAGKYEILVRSIGYTSQKQLVHIEAGQIQTLSLQLEESTATMDEVVITGTMKEVNRMESPVPVEAYTPKFFKKNPTPNMFDAMQNINGVRPQLNCNVCNTGDIHINGLEGPYTMVLIDGMPIVSSLATVYGLSGIPNSMIKRLEVVKGPASSLYGSEAVGGLINIITKDPQNTPVVSGDFFGTTWGEYNADLGVKVNAGSMAGVLTGINYFNFQNIIDNNDDNFTDVALQERISIFQKWNFKRKSNRLFSIAWRYFYEDRWGGDVHWTPEFRGGDEIYGESIYTKRWEFLGSYQLPTLENMVFSFSYNKHDQNSVYGDTPYLATQHIGFGQLAWDKQLKSHDLLAGTALRYNWYDDNTPATESDNPANLENRPDEYFLPGVFVQDEITFNPSHKLLLGLRYDYHDRHGSIFTPRLAYKWTLGDRSIIRLNAGTGFRVVNLFTEDHAALTGARDVVIVNELLPERSYNLNLNYLKHFYLSNGMIVSLEGSAWYTYFTNVILPDYETDPNLIIYDNIDGHAVSQGISLNTDVEFINGLKLLAGFTLMDVSRHENGVRERQLLTERFTGTWALSYTIRKLHLAIDYTGNVYGPMKLPLLSDLDPRLPYSPTWSIQNIQFTYSGWKQFEFYGGVKNLLNWTPNEGNPFIIARTEDPFDKEVVFDENGQAVPTPNNPYGLTFDPTYVYAPNQGIRGFLGLRFSFR